MSVTSFDDHSGRGGGYSENLGSYGNAGNAGHYENGGVYENYAGENKDQQQGYQSYGASNAEYSSQDSGPVYGHQAQSLNFAQMPQVALYQIQNGAATAIQYPHAGLQQLINAGYQVQNGYQNQEDNSYANNQLGYGSQGYQQQAHTEEGNYQQQHAVYAAGNAENQGNAYQNSHAYGNQNQQNAGYGNVNQEASTYGYQNQEGHSNQEGYQNQEGYSNQEGHQNQEGYANQEGHQNQEGYGNQEGYQNQEGYSNQGGYQKQETYGNAENSNAYHNVASYQVSPNTAGYQNDVGYNNQEIASGLQNYGLSAAYAVQPGTENHNQGHGATGTVYVRAYGNNQGGNQQAAYGVQTHENYQAQDSQQQKSYAAFSSTKSISSLVASATPQSDTTATAKLSVAASGRSYDSQTSEPIIGSSSGYSQPAGDAKGGSWHGVQ